MVKQFKLAATVSVVAVALTACAPNPYWQNGNYNRGGGSAAVNRNAVTHTHCGKTHTHVLPPQGLAHHHGDGCMAGSASAARPYTASTTYRPPANTYQPNYQTQYQGAANAGSSTYGYTDYSGGAAAGNYATAGGSSTYYDYSKPKAPSSNSSAGYGASSGGSSYYDYTAPSASGSSGYYDYSGSASSSYGSSSSTSKPSSYSSGSSTSVNSNYTGGGTYTVQKGDTVFQVMRNTGVYWKDIIRLNSLQAPDYKLSPGQQLRLK
jgi:LysM repeat protein